MLYQKRFMYALALACALFPSSARATVECVTLDDPVSVNAGETFVSNTFIMVWDEPMPCGSFSTIHTLAWGGTVSGSTVTLESGTSVSDSSQALITAPSSPGLYSYETTCYLTLCSGGTTSNSMAVWVDANTSGGSSGDPEGDIDVVALDFAAPYVVDQEICGWIRLRNNGGSDYAIDAVDLDAFGISRTWSDDEDGTDFVLDPGESRWVGDPFCLTPTSAGTLELAVDVRLEGESTWYDLEGRIYLPVEPAPDPCAGVSCTSYCGWGEVRYWGGVPTPSGSACSCLYTTTDCDAMDTTPYTVAYCASGNQRRVYDTYVNYSCNFATATCTGTTVQVNDRLLQVCPYGCASGACITCTPEWTCTTWSSCSGGPTRSRVCYDLNDCGTDVGRPPEVESCPCTLEEVYWSADQAVDGETVQFVIETSGACAGECFTWELREWDWSWFARDDLESGGADCFTGNGGMVREWTAKFDPHDWWGFSDYYMVVEFNGQEEETDPRLEVEPRRDYVQSLVPFLEERTFPSLPPSDYLCFQGAAVTITSTCLEWWEQAEEYAEAEFEENLEEVIQFITGETTLEVIWTIACTLCETGAVEVGVVAACSAPPVCPFAAGIGVGVCGYACFTVVTEWLTTFARTAWREALGPWLAHQLDTLGVSGWAVVRSSVDETGAYAFLRNDWDETWDFWIFPDHSDPNKIITKGVPNAIRHYSGGGRFLQYKRLPRNSFPDGRNLFRYSKEQFTPGPEGEFALLGSLFQEDDFPLVWEQSWSDLAGVDEAIEGVEQINFVTIIPGDDLTDPRLLGLTSAVSGGTTRIQFALWTTDLLHGERARLMILRRAVPHEVGHATAMNALRRVGYQLSSGSLRGAWNEYPIEFLNDANVLANLRGNLQGEFYSATREWIAISYATIPDGASEHRGRRFIREFVDAITRDELDHAHVWRLVSLKAYADEFGLTDLAMVIDMELTAELASHPEAVQETAHDLLANRVTQLREDAVVYAEHLLDDTPTVQFDAIVCARYRLTANCLFEENKAFIQGPGERDRDEEGKGSCAYICLTVFQCSYVRDTTCARWEPNNWHSCEDVSCDEIPEPLPSGCACALGARPF